MLGGAREYRAHYQRHYCCARIVTFDDIRVYFRPQKFDHAFYENSQNRFGPKDMFCEIRAQRMDWIKATLEAPDAKLYIGWNKCKKCLEENRRVSVVYDDFVVIIEMSLSKGILKANFVTCFEADRSIEKIRQAPAWEKGRCIKMLKK
jgi:hypothetical protein